MTFNKILKKYDEIFKENIVEGRLPMRSTDYGFWGTAPVFALYEFFTKVQLDRYKSFLDLGSGDGRAVLLASLFTKATGIEGDPELIAASEKIRDELGMKSDFICEDFMKHDFSQYDFIFINPDKGFSDSFQEKLKKELKGPLYIYNHLFLPTKLKKGKTMWIDQIPVIRYDSE